jgi:hypothetical protein
MVESQQENDEEVQDYGQLDDDDGDMPPYYTFDMMYPSNNDSNEELDARTNSGLSNHSRPISR